MPLLRRAVSRAHDEAADDLEAPVALSVGGDVHRGDVSRAATILAATEAAREAMDLAPDEDEEATRAIALELVGERTPVVETAWAEGRTLDLETTVALTERS